MSGKHVLGIVLVALGGMLDLSFIYTIYIEMDPGRNGTGYYYISPLTFHEVIMITAVIISTVLVLAGLLLLLIRAKEEF